VTAALSYLANIYIVFKLIENLFSIFINFNVFVNCMIKILCSYINKDFVSMIMYYFFVIRIESRIYQYKTKLGPLRFVFNQRKDAAITGL